MNRKILIAKPGLDGHDRGAKVVAAMLRDAGFEVVYTGLHQTPEMIVQAALQEDVAAVGLSVLSGAHNTIFPRVRALLDEAGLSQVLLFGGGVIPDQDAQDLQTRCRARIFGPGTASSVYLAWLNERLQ